MNQILKKSLASLILILCFPVIVNAENYVNIGNVNVDLDSGMQSLTGADNTYYYSIMNDNYEFTGSGPTLQVTDGKVYGTPTFPFQTEYVTKLTSPNSTAFDLLWKEQQLITLDTYTFINRVPEELSFPMPVYVSDGEDNPNGWNFDKPTEMNIQNSGDVYTNTKITIKNLRNKLKDNDYISYTYNIKSATGNLLQVTPIYTFVGNNGETTTSNSISWNVSVPIDVLYTVDIAPITVGGTPTLTGLKGGTRATEDVLGINSHYFRAINSNNLPCWGDDSDATLVNGDVNEGFTEHQLALGGIANLGGTKLNGIRNFGTYGTKYSYTDGVEDGYLVDYVKVTIYDPATEEKVSENTYNSVEEALKANNTIKGKTEIRIAYIKEKHTIWVENTTVDNIGGKVEVVNYEDTTSTISSDGKDNHENNRKETNQVKGIPDEGYEVDTKNIYVTIKDNDKKIITINEDNTFTTTIDHNNITGKVIKNEDGSVIVSMDLMDFDMDIGIPFVKVEEPVKEEQPPVNQPQKPIEEVENPNTLDGCIKWLIIGSFSVAVMVVVCDKLKKYQPKKKNIR